MSDATPKAKKAKKIRYDHLNFRLAEWEEEPRIIDFVNEHFDLRLPLVNHRAFFTHYYCGKRLQFALAEQDGALVAVAGYILANESDTPDLWVSVWVALKGAMGAGLELMDAIPGLTGARVVACNNIRENTCPFYRFLGWTAERLPHYYRISKAASEGDCQLFCADVVCDETPEDSTASQGSAVPAAACAAAQQVATHETSACAQDAAPHTPRLAVSGDLTLEKVTDAAALAALGLPVNNELQTPAKDLAYLQRRYFAYPYQSYDVWSVQEAGALLAYCITRTVDAYFESETAAHGVAIANNSTHTTTTATAPSAQENAAAGKGATPHIIPVLRIVDFIGDASVLPRIGKALDDLMEASHAEYTDCYCAGIDPAVFAAAGFAERTADSTVTVPNYLTPALRANTDYFYFTNHAEGFTLFKADGDQDRPNL